MWRREDDFAHDGAGAIDSVFGVRCRIVDAAAYFGGIH
jgi:hypothetical protein